MTAYIAFEPEEIATPWARTTVAALAAAAALILAIHFQPPILSDDAAITFRYAERFAAGHGLTYNDHERVLGTSSPLYAIALGVVSRVSGAEVEQVARTAGIVTYVIAAVLLAELAVTLGGAAGGVAAGLIFLADTFVRYQMMCGLEVGLAVVLALAAAVAAARGNETVSGVLLGLALWNKLDAAALAVPLIVAMGIAEQRFPVKMIAAAAAVVLPWYAWAWFAYGSVVPNSVVAKLSGGENQPFNRWWVIEFLKLGHRVFALVLAVVAVETSDRMPVRERALFRALAAWAILHTAAYSLVNLGARYPWYVAMPPVAIAIMAGAILRPDPEGPRYALWLRIAGAAVAAWIVANGFVETRREWIARTGAMPLYEAFDADRRAAGQFLRAHARPGEVLETGFGWPAYESRLVVNDTTLLNSVDFLREPPDYGVIHGSPLYEGSHPPQVPEGMIPLATFNDASHQYPGTTWFIVFGKPDSAVAKASLRRLRYRLFELAPVEDTAAPSGVDLALPGSDEAAFTIPNVPGEKRLIFTLGRGSVAIEVDGRRVFETAGTENPATKLSAVLAGPNDTAKELRFIELNDDAAQLRDVEVQIGRER